MAKLPIFPELSAVGEVCIVGGTADLILGRPVDISTVAGDITSMGADGVCRIVIKTTDALPGKGIALAIPGWHDVDGTTYDTDTGDHFIAAVGQPVLVFKEGEICDAEIGGTVDTTSDTYSPFLIPGTNGLVKAIDTTGAKHFYIAKLLVGGTYAAGDIAKVIVTIGQITTAAAV